ncbi:DUF3667 domain-containing protein [Flavobacterium sp. MAH-1]|uniref:DUF3667 domain-containing protein n=1 Tax=Flavobacterium agri TaxID=2743471 RepID=A0A7Y9C8K6_9FLAO|nr:DUF3667 domain-containing protein [Flavobacterium agri]NUY82473.1 DUF3667 domain-containing protein [Flavobacterium agri]NYA72497.1 DUF3667 domain-containing protein [Flavobacterium agri]
MTSKNCLNCEKELTDEYCSGCGQKADTHRISFKNFIFHDVLHGTFHFERGMLFTAKQALTRPGQAALDYISGKRKRYYNVFLLVLVTFGLIVFLRHYFEGLYVSLGGKPDVYNDDSASAKINEVIAQKSKLIIFLFVPLSALNSFILFRRKKLNLSEHFIIAGMILLGMLLLSVFGNTVFYLTLIVKSDFFNSMISIVTPALIFLYMIYGYFNAFGSDYSRLGITYRIALFFVFCCLEVYLLLVLVIGYYTDWKFGTVTLRPFG